MTEKKKAENVGTEEAVLKPDPSKDKEGDSIRISSEVIAVITSIISSDIPGVAGMSGGVVGGIAERLGRKDMTRGIKVQVDEDKVSIDLNIIVDYGVSIVDTTDKLKKEIRNSIEKTTGLTVQALNINVLGIVVPDEEGEEEVEEKKVEEKKK